MNTKIIKESFSEADTELFAIELAWTLKPGCIVALHGELGAGKTVFARSFAKGIGVTEQVSSPTYTIVQEYPLDNGTIFFHLDLYRIDNPDSALAFGVDEYFAEPNAYTLVEWPERVSTILPETTIHIHIRHTGEFSRQITLKMP
jgi:tRNA threonylcarbamoyladenosine biosynthesis protein TsaE